MDYWLACIFLDRFFPGVGNILKRHLKTERAVLLRQRPLTSLFLAYVAGTGWKWRRDIVVVHLSSPIARRAPGGRSAATLRLFLSLAPRGPSFAFLSFLYDALDFLESAIDPPPRKPDIHCL
ncbi:Hypothetical protein NTJ_05408 [Nesidiocoris tenuis]|uniref:Uncharacterized protein n=1 Tax=Nesidiocoris tenuis TaxID=355587 RepID=A0ABN7AME4_9HEMI|nr:Hypothetical protein NTJ_05408 [Nesidiocoris tenuis]